MAASITLEALGLEPPLIPSVPEEDIALWFVDVVGRIGSLLERLRRVLQMQGDHIVNLVGNLILMWVHRFAPNFPFARIFEKFGNNAAGRSAKETARADVAGVVTKLMERVNRLVPKP
jgi:hypothetical protein